MEAVIEMSSLIETLPPVRGRYSENVALSKATWFGVGGPAEVVFRPADEEDLAAFLTAKPADVSVCVIGVASNLLVRDGGIPGVVVRLRGAFAHMKVEETQLIVGASALDSNVALLAAETGISGMAFLSGVPGTIGGALRMNAGAYGCEMKDIVASVRAVDPQGKVHVLGPEELGFSYRHCSVSEDWIFTEAILKGRPGKREEIIRVMADIRATREANQPIRVSTGGSTFANPPGEKAWKLIDRAGCRGLRRGGAQVSDKHCNFLINSGDATAADLEGLGEEVRRRVLDATGVTLEWEIKRIGIPAGQNGEGGSLS
jgi:UDP-N-acetylmuramate dehydrogenase